MKIKILALLLVAVMLLSACVSTAEPTTLLTDASGNPAADTTPTGNNEVQNGDGTTVAPSTDENDNTEPTVSNPENTDGATEDTTGNTNGGDSDVQTSQGSTPTETVEGPKDYEEYLAALTLFALSMEYPDFILEGIYTATAVSIAKNYDSAGIYTVFESGGMRMIFHVYPIGDERSDSGTRDLYAAEIGYAAFDQVDSLPEGLRTLEQSVYASKFSALSAISLFTH